MDVTDLRAEKIRNTLAAEGHLTDLHARRYVAMMAVALTVLGTVVVAGSSARWRWDTTVVLAVLPVFMFLDQYLRYRVLSPTLKQATKTANRRIDRLIMDLEEPWDDGPENDP